MRQIHCDTWCVGQDGLSRHPLKVENTGSNPVRTTDGRCEDSGYFADNGEMSVRIRPTEETRWWCNGSTLKSPVSLGSRPSTFRSGATAAHLTVNQGVAGSNPAFGAKGESRVDACTQVLKSPIIWEVAGSFHSFGAVTPERHCRYSGVCCRTWCGAPRG